MSGITASPLSQKLIPLPKKVQASGSIFLAQKNVVLRMPKESHPQLDMAKEMLQPFACGESGFELMLVFAQDPKNCPAFLRKALSEVKNKDQAYAIEPVIKQGEFSGLTLVGNEPIGLLYAARTLSQLFSSSEYTEKIEIPQINILDWPDLEERGMWGWNLPHDRHSMAALKMNEIEIHSTLGFTNDGSPTATLDEEFLKESFRIGIQVVPIINHLEQLANTGLFSHHPQVVAIPEPGKTLPEDYEPAICFSNPKSIELIAGWMREILAYDEISDVIVWLAELPSSCFCDLCCGQNSFVLQTKALVAAFHQVCDDLPNKHLRILLTQASYPDNDKILDAGGKDTRITYYHGQLTYDSSHQPMIYPLLEKFAKSGNWLGVYPQLTNSWHTIFPFSGAHFIKARMNEFVDKQLRNCSGYATPANCYYDFNIAAAAEWGWNSKGRSEKEFAKAYAIQVGIDEPEVFAEWADIIGQIGWKIAGSRIVESSIFAAGGQVFRDGFFGVGEFFDKKRPLKFGEGILQEFEDMSDLDDSLNAADNSLRLAQQEEEPIMVFESQCVLGTLKYVKKLYEFFQHFSQNKNQADISQLADILNEFDKIAKGLTISIYQWGRMVHPAEHELIHYRFRDTVDFAANIANQLRQWVHDLGIADPHPEYRFSRIAEWKSEDFAKSATIEIWADVTDFVSTAGEYDVQLSFSGGASGVKPQAVTLLTGANKKDTQPLFVERWESRIDFTRFVSYIEYWITVPPRCKNLTNRGDRLYLKIEILGPSLDLPKDRRTSNGRIFIRKSWRDAEYSD